MLNGIHRTTTVAVLGSGVESRAQLEAMHALGLAERARVYSPTAANRERFAAEYAASLGIDVEAVGDARAAVAGAGIVVAAVKSSEHAFFGAWLEPGVHVNSVGTARPDQREIDPETFRRSDIVVVDTRHGVFSEAGDAIVANDVISPDDVSQLSEVVASNWPRRTNDRQITLFKSIGTAIQDIALAAKIYERARDRGLGTDFPDFLNIKRT